MLLYDAIIDDYENYLKRADFMKHKKYLEHFDCDNVKSCDALAIEYQKAAFKCDDLYSKLNYGNTNEKGQVTDKLCKDLNKKKKELIAKRDSFRILSNNSPNTGFARTPDRGHNESGGNRTRKRRHPKKRGGNRTRKRRHPKKRGGSSKKTRHLKSKNRRTQSPARLHHRI
jgi:hypothetical protein